MPELILSLLNQRRTVVYNRLLESQIMNRKGVLSEPRRPSPDSQETSPLLTAYCDHFHVASGNTGGSAVDGTALRRNEQDGKNIAYKTSLHVPSKNSMVGDNGETYDNVPKDKRQLGQVTS